MADEQIDTFIADGKCEFMNAFAQPFAVLVASDLLGVPHEDRAGFRQHLIRGEQVSGGAVVGGTDGEVNHGPLEWLYGKFSAYIADRRLNLKEDNLTGLANATFPGGAVPEPIDVARVAANLFAAGQETTLRLLHARTHLNNTLDRFIRFSDRSIWSQYDAVSSIQVKVPSWPAYRTRHPGKHSQQALRGNLLARCQSSYAPDKQQYADQFA